MPAGLPLAACPRCSLLSALSPALEQSEKPGDSIGRYKLLQKIGEGGCGVVYMAEQIEPVHRRVALKVIKLGMDTAQVIARFEAERQALALMDHPNIAKVLDAGATESGRPYFVMELVRGKRVTEYCDHEKLSTGQRLELFKKVCQAVQHAHQKGIIHRDIKPSNVMVTLHDGVPVPKVIDFGIAKATTGQRLTDRTLFTAFEQFLGTPAYMSPEQAELSGLDIDTRSDIYSLGVLLYELLTGRTPFDKRDLLAAGWDEIRRRIREEEPLKPSTRLRTLLKADLTIVARERSSDPAKFINSVSGDLDWIVMKCLEKDRTRRYETANGLAMDLQRHLDREPVIARPPTTAYRVQKFIWRNKGMVAATATITTVLVLGLATSTWQWRSAISARRGEAQQRQRAEERAAAEAEAKLAETRQRLRAEHAVSQMRIQKADECRANEQALTALSYLARVLRDDPSNHVAAGMLLATLSYHSFCLPTVEPLQHNDAVMFAEFSPDGSRIVTASRDRTARVWDASTGQALTEPLKHDGIVKTARFSPDGDRIVTACVAVLDNTVPLRGRSGGYARVWDARTGQPLTAPLKHRLEVNHAEFSPDGQRVVTAAFDFTRVWDVRTGHVLAQLLTYNSNVQYAHFSPDGERLVTACIDSQVWNSQTGEPLTKPLRHHGRTAQFSPNGRLVVTSSPGGAWVWDARTGLNITLLKHRYGVNWAEFSPDGQSVVTSSSDKTARVWDVGSGKELCEPLKHKARVVYARFSSDGQQIITASADNTAQIWDARTGQRLVEPLTHEGPIHIARFSPDGQKAVTASADKTASVWDVRNGQALPKFLDHKNKAVDGWSAQFSPNGAQVVTSCFIMKRYASYARVWDARTADGITEPLKHGFVRSAQFSADGKMILTGSSDPFEPIHHTAQIWESRTGIPLTEPYFQAGGVRSVRFSPEGNRVVTAGNRSATVWDALTGQTVSILKHSNWVCSAQFSPEGRRVLTASWDETARIWDARTGHALTEPLKHRGAVWSAQFSADGQRAVTASLDKTARVWDALTGRALTEPLEHNGEVTCAQFDKEGQRVVTACGSAGEHAGYAQIWDASTGHALTEPLKHNGNVDFVQFSPDGQQVVTASRDETIRVWDARTGQAVTDPIKHDGGVTSAEFSPDGRWLLTVARDGVRLWDFPSASLPIPDWLAGFAEAVAGQRFNQNGRLEPVPPAEFFPFRRKMKNGDDVYSLWVKWFVADRSTRTISPFSSITISAHVRDLIKENTTESLRQAINLSPTNGLAFARMARQTLTGNDKELPHRIAEAEFLSRRAVELLPQDAEVQQVRAEVIARSGLEQR